MGFAIHPSTGPNSIVVGDAAGSINPFNGEGIAYGYETGRLAAACLSRALAGEGSDAISDYEQRLHDSYGDYYRVGRAFVKLISNPQVLRALHENRNGRSTDHDGVVEDHGQLDATRCQCHPRDGLPGDGSRRQASSGLFTEHSFERLRITRLREDTGTPFGV